jgi:membrane protease YdiL (CAAX protease family)
MATQDHTATGTLTRPSERSLALWEIASVAVSCLIAEWAVPAFAPKRSWLILVPSLLAFGLMVFSHYERGETLRDIGFRLDNFVSATRLIALPTLVAMALIAFSAWGLISSEFSMRPIRLRLLLVPAWALMQQYALQGFLNRRAQMVLGSGWKSVVAVAILFSIFHLPSPLLIVLTLLGGLAWAFAYQRQPNLFALALSHFAVSITLTLTLPTDLSRNLRVGLRYLGLGI